MNIFDDYSDLDPDEEFEVIEHNGIVAEAKKAVLLEIKGKNYWFPKSQIQYDSEVVNVPYWFEMKEAE